MRGTVVAGVDDGLAGEGLAGNLPDGADRDRHDYPVPDGRRLRGSCRTRPRTRLPPMCPLPMSPSAAIKGRSGGVRLGRSADRITLGEIYRSSIGDKPL